MSMCHSISNKRDTAGAVFHKELARELVEFILPIVEREFEGTMSLMDVYCVFNRARGVGKVFSLSMICFRGQCPTN